MNKIQWELHKFTKWVNRFMSITGKSRSKAIKEFRRIHSNSNVYKSHSSW